MQVRQLEQASGGQAAVDASAKLQTLQRQFEESERLRKEREAKLKTLEEENAKLKAVKPAPATDPKAEEEAAKAAAKIKELQAQLDKSNAQLDAADKSLKAAQAKSAQNSNDIDYTFTWPYGGKEPAIGGTFNDWKVTFQNSNIQFWREIEPFQVQKMTRNGDDFNTTVTGLKPNTKYLYKYNIDGKWQEDLTAPTDNSEKVNGRPVINNVLLTGSADRTTRLLVAEKERDALFRQVCHHVKMTFLTSSGQE